MMMAMAIAAMLVMVMVVVMVVLLLMAMVAIAASMVVMVMVVPSSSVTVVASIYSQGILPSLPLVLTSVNLEGQGRNDLCLFLKINFIVDSMNVFFI